MSTTVETAGRVRTMRTKVPSRHWYWLAAAIAVLGLGIGVAWAVVSTVRTHDIAAGLPRTGTPGAVEVAVAGGTSRLIYFEGDGRPAPDALDLKVSGPDGSPLAVKPYDALMQYDIAGWVGTPIASFSTPVEGTYMVTAGNAIAGGEISVGDNFVRTQLFEIVEAFGLILVSFACSVVLIVVVSVKRSPRQRGVALDRTR